MIWTMIEYAAIFLECFMLSRFLIKYFGLRSNERKLMKYILIFSCLSLVDCIGSFILMNEIFNITGIIITSIMFSFAFLNGNLFEKIVISVAAYMLFYFVNIPVLTIISFLSDISPADISDPETHHITRMIGIFITKLLYFIATQLVLIVRKKERYQFRLNEWIIIASAFIITLTIGFNIHALVVGYLSDEYIYIIMALLLSLLDIIIFVFMGKLNIAGKQETEKELLQFQLQQQQKEVQNLEHQYQEMSILRHDFNNKVQCIYTLLKQDNTNDAIRYAEKILQLKSSAVQQYIHSSSSVINAIINDKIEKAEKNKIDVSCRITTTVPEYMEYDLSILLANLIDNAIEACQKNTTASKIYIIITETAGYYRIAVRNTIQESVLNKNKKLESDKKDKKNHGWGLKSVHEIVEKYMGSMDVYENEGRFIVSIMLIKNEDSNMGD